MTSSSFEVPNSFSSVALLAVLRIPWLPCLLSHSQIRPRDMRLPVRTYLSVVKTLKPLTTWARGMVESFFHF
jgi:hypothetical protein